MRSFFTRIKEILHIPSRETMTTVFEKMGITEKIIFFFFFLLFTSSALVMLYKVNAYLSEDIPVDGGTIYEGVVGYPRYINPLLPVTDSGKDLSSLIYSGLYKSNPDGTLIPDLAKSHEVSEDGLIYTITLKDDIYFHDDMPVTAFDVEFTIKKAVDPLLKSPKAPNWAGVEVKVLGEKQVQFILKNPYAPFLENLTLGILPQHIWKNIDAEGFLFSQFNFEPVGSGPYKVYEIQRNESGLPLYYHLVPFSKYALGKPYLSNLILKFYVPDKLIPAYRAGEIQNISAISPAEASQLKKEGAHILQAPLPRLFAIFFNQNEAPVLANREVRLALNEAVDKEMIINEVLDGYGTEAEGPLPPQYSTLENLKSEGKTEEERTASARKILEDAGWTLNANGMYEKDDKKSITPLSFSIATANLPELKAVAEIVKKQWEKLGAKVTIKIFERSDLQQNVISTRKYDAILFGEVISKDLDLFAFWHSSERNYPGLNLSLYTNVKVDKLLSEARAISDIKAKREFYSDIEKEIIKDVPAIFLYSPDFIYVTPSYLKGININGIGAPEERFLTANDWYIESEKVWSFFIKNN